MSGWSEVAYKNALTNPDIVVADDATMPAAPRGGGQVTQKGEKDTQVLENRFLALWSLAGCPALEREHRFDEVRRWRFDFAHPATMVAIEIEGGLHSRGRHLRPDGYRNDAEKYNHAALGGWQVYRLTSDMITMEWCEKIADVIVTALKAMEGKQ